MKSGFDPIELELFKNLFVSISEEMGAVLGRTALSPNIKERRDFSCALFNARGETFAQGTHIPVHLGAMPLSVQKALERISFDDGDIVILNDPFCGGTHLPDITMIAPVFIGGRLRFLVANRAHHSDVGGMSPGSMPLATEIFQEGLIIPPLKLVSKGVMNEAAFDIILANVRTPDERRGDLLAQVAANGKGRERLLEVVEKYGVEKIDAYTVKIQDYTEKILRKAIAAIPDGEYEFADFMDDDGITDDPVRIQVRIKISRDSAIVDFTGSAPQTTGGINANLAITYSAVLYVFRSLIEDDIPINSGLMKPIRVIAPAGSIVNALRPAAMAGGNVETSQRLVDVLLGALGKAMPQKIPAASQGTMNNIAFGGFDAERKQPFAYYETIGGGCGGGAMNPGLDGTHSHMTNSLNTPAEALELYMPVRIKKYSLRKDSGGSGKNHGGEGITREYEFAQAMNVSIISERRWFAPYGAAGGGAGRKGLNTLISRGKKKKLGSKCNFNVNAGDILRIETPGGGGYGKDK